MGLDALTETFSGIMMDDRLTADEYDALGQIAKGQKSTRHSACVARNAKRLSGLKYASFGKDGSLTITEKGQQTMLVKNCIDGLRAVANDPHAQLDSVVVTFLCKKGHIVAEVVGNGYALTERGRETLADIDANQA
jgi:hypothetical protein